jgi:multidrug efflux system outer membrane protein
MLGFRVLAAVAVSLSVAACAVTPQPVTRQELSEIIRDDRALIVANQEPISQPITLYGAMARAVQYNLDHRSRLVEEALNRGQVDLARFDMLPILAASGGYIGRDEPAASSSRSIATQRQSLEPSTSSDRDRTIYDARLSWNILDFGVSYFQAQQTANRYIISQLARERLMLRMIQQVRTAYWRALAAQNLRPEVTKVLGDARLALADIDRAQRERLQPPLQSLQLRRALLELVGQLEALDQPLAQALVELNTLMNQPPKAETPIAGTTELPKLPEVPTDLDRLELIALHNSFDVQEQIYNKRIEQAETRKALLRMLPGIEFGVGHQFDSNSFLAFNHWNEVSARVTWNIFRVLSYNSVTDVAEAREQLAVTKRLAMNMATISRVNLSWRRYADAAMQLGRAQEIDAVERQIAQLSANQSQADAGSRVERIRNEASALRARLRTYESFANAQDALGTFYVSLGLNPVPTDFQQIRLSDLEAALATAFRSWEGGQIPDPTTAEAPPAPRS